MRTLTKKIIFSVFAALLAVSCFMLAHITFNKRIVKADAPTVTCSGVNIYNNNAVNGNYYITLIDYNTNLGSSANSTNVVSTTGQGITLNGVRLSEISGAKIDYAHGTTHMQILIPKSYQDALTGDIILEVIAGTTFESQVLDGAKFWLTSGGKWQTMTSATFSDVRHNNVNYGTHSITVDTNSGIYATLRFTESFGATADAANLATDDYEIGKGLNINGVPIKDISGAFVDYAHGEMNMSVYVPFTGLSEYHRATLTVDDGTAFKGKSINGFSVYFKGSSWSTTPNTKTAVNFSTIAWNNINHEGAAFGGAGVLLRYDANLSTVANDYNGNIKSEELKSFYGRYITLNGETLDNIAGAELRYHSQGNLWIYAPSMTAWNGHVPTIEIAANTPFLDASLPALTLYLNGSAWQTSNPRRAVNFSTIAWNNQNFDTANLGGGAAGLLLRYDANLSLVANEINGNIKSTELKSVYGSYITLNGQTLDNIAGAELRYHSQGNLWIYAPDMTTWAGHTPTIEIAENAPFSYSYLPALTLCFNGSQWGVYVAPTVVCSGVNAYNNNAVENSYYRTLIDYNTSLGSAANSTNVVSTTGHGITLNGVSLSEISGATVNYAHGTTHMQILIPKSYQDALTGNIILEVIAGTTFESQVLDGAKFALTSGSWKRVYNVTLSRVRWNDEDTGGNYDGKKGVLLQFDANLSTVASEINGNIRSTNLASTVGEYIYLGGQKLSALPGALVSYHSQDNLFIYADNMSAYRTFTIEEGTPVLNALLPEINLYYNGNSKWTTTDRTISPVTYSNIQWNNIGYQTFEGKNGVLLNFSANLSLNSGEINGGLSSANLKDIYGSYITLNGETLDNIANAELAYYNTTFLWIYAPGMTTWENHVPTLEIAASTQFLDVYLPAVSIYFYSGELKDVAPKILTVNYTAGDMSCVKFIESSITVDADYLAGILYEEYGSITVLGWTIGETDYFYGDTPSVSETATVNITNVLNFHTQSGASIRLSSDGITGLRYESRIKTADYNALFENYENVEFGTYIAPKSMLDAYLVANSSATFRDYFAQAQGSGSSSKYVKIVNEGIFNQATYETDGYVKFYGSLANVYEINYYTKFVGVGYVKFVKGGNTYVFYGATSLTNTTRTVYDVAKAAYNDTTTDYSSVQLNVIKGYLDAVADLTYKQGNLNVNEVITGREYTSPYNASHNNGYYYVARFGSEDVPATIIINGKKISSSHFGTQVNAGSLVMHISDANMAALFTDGVVYGVGEPDSTLWANNNTVATASMLSDITGALNATAFRVWMSDNVNIGPSNNISLVPAKTIELKNLIDGLADNGVKEIYIIGQHLPSATYANYYVNGVGWETVNDYYSNHNGTGFYRDYHCVPDPSTEAAAYAEWLKVQSDYYTLLTAQIATWQENSPAWNGIKFYFEGINEPEGQVVIHKRGNYNFGTGEYTYNYFDNATLAKILTDVAYYMTLAVNTNLNGTGFVTMPALMYLSSGSGNVSASGISSDGLLSAMASAIKDAVAPTAILGISPVNTNDPEDYFTVLNWHPYLSWTKSNHEELYYAEITWVNDGTPSGKLVAEVNGDYVADWVAWNNGMYSLFVNQFTGFAPKVVFTEFGMMDYGSYAQSNEFFTVIGVDETLAATVFRTILAEGIDDLTFSDNCTIIAFRLCDVESILKAEQATQGYLDVYVYGEGNIGLIEEDGTIKNIMEEYYYIINGTRDTTGLQTVVSGYYD